LNYLLVNLLKGTKKANKFDFSVEVHPNHLSNDQLTVLNYHGFKRISIGVQDVDITVQKAIHRIQPKEITTSAIHRARQHGFESVNVDLVYGLPKQTMESMKQTVEAVLHWHPERIALYSYAHVPWKSKSQRGYDENDLPSAKEKLDLFAYASEQLTQFGYQRVGMDHFALPLDDLAVAYQEKKLHRNFMGYTPRHTQVLIGLGVSSISDCGDGFAQNDKDIDAYQAKVSGSKFPIEKGHLHTESETWIRKRILELMCQNYTEWDSQDPEARIMGDVLVRLQPLLADGLVELTSTSIQVTSKGEAFVRNICHCVDQSQHSHLEGKPVFSRAI
jgi:oxygen-independent coproporphyrinogen-3 oxidase